MLLSSITITLLRQLSPTAGNNVFVFLLVSLSCACDYMALLHTAEEVAAAKTTEDIMGLGVLISLRTNEECL